MRHLTAEAQAQSIGQNLPITRIKNLILGDGVEEGHDAANLFLVMEFMEYDLSDILTQANELNLSESTVKLLLY